MTKVFDGNTGPGSARVVAIIQARLGSTRLPGKVLRDLAGAPMLLRVVNRVRRAANVAETVVATSDLARDDAIVDLCRDAGVPVWRGSEADVLARYRGAAEHFGAAVIVRVTSDCPFIDPAVVDLVVAFWSGFQPDVDYCSNISPRRCWPRGLDTEVFSRDALERAHREDDDPALREHVTPYIYRHPELFKLMNVTSAEDHSDLRWTVDTPEDLAVAEAVYDHFGDDRFGWRAVLDLVRMRPELAELNRNVDQKVLQPTAR